MLLWPNQLSQNTVNNFLEARAICASHCSVFPVVDFAGYSKIYDELS